MPGTMRRREILQNFTALLAGMMAPRLKVEAGTTLPATETGSPQAPGKTAAGATPPVNLFDYEALARRRLSRMAYDYVAGGAADEITLRRNRESFDAMRLKPRVLVDVSKLDTRLELFGQQLPFPILLAPTAYHKLVHPQGERATAQGAGAAGATLVVSSFATLTIEDVARAASGSLWFQLYVQRDRAFTRELVERAEAAGCRALCITVDTPIAGTRNFETRNRFRLPPGMEVANLKALARKYSKMGHVTQNGIYSLGFARSPNCPLS